MSGGIGGNAVEALAEGAAAPSAACDDLPPIGRVGAAPVAANAPQAHPAAATGGGELRAALWALRREFAAVGAFSLAIHLLMLAPTLYMLQVFDRVLASRSEGTLVAVSALTLLLLTVAALAEKARASTLVRAGMRLDALLAPRVLAAGFRASLEPAHPPPGQAMADLTELRQFITGPGAFVFFDAPWSPLYVVVLFFLHPALGGLALFFAAVQGLLAWRGHHQALAPSRRASQALARANAQLAGQLAEAEAALPMGMAGALRAHWWRGHQAQRALQGAALGLTHRVAAWSKFLRYAQQSLVLAAGALLVVEGRLSPGAMIAANLLTARALAPIDLLVGSWRGWIGAQSAWRRLQALLRPADGESAAGPARSAAGCVVEFRGLVATAPGRQAPILKGVDARIEAGTVTLVTGPSGSGKSTLARALLGIWPGVRGDALLLGRPAAAWDRAEVGPRLGYLPQGVELLDGSVAENIARFAEVDAGQVIAAAQAAGVHEMVLRLPQGYDTPVGEGAGGPLSAGQLQRIGLARALYGAPDLVVLDEPNAHLDEAGELALIDAVRGLRARGAAVVVVSHRPGVMALADQALQLDDGRLHRQADPPPPGTGAQAPT